MWTFLFLYSHDFSPSHHCFIAWYNNKKGYFSLIVNWIPYFFKVVSYVYFVTYIFYAKPHAVFAIVMMKTYYELQLTSKLEKVEIILNKKNAKIKVHKNLSSLFFFSVYHNHDLPDWCRLVSPATIDGWRDIWCPLLIMIANYPSLHLNIFFKFELFLLLYSFALFVWKITTTWGLLENNV